MFPNEAEQNAYLNDAQNLKGIFVFIDADCPWNKCEQGHMSIVELQNKKIEMRINGFAVVGFLPFGGGGVIPVHKDGKVFPAEKLPHIIELKVLEQDSFVKLTSITVM
jgi:hypothetical protein